MEVIDYVILDGIRFFSNIVRFYITRWSYEQYLNAAAVINNICSCEITWQRRIQNPTQYLQVCEWHDNSIDNNNTLQ